MDLCKKTQTQYQKVINYNNELYQNKLKNKELELENITNKR